MGKKQSTVRFEQVPFEKLVFLEDNPRTRTDEGWRKMEKSLIEDPGFYESRRTLVNFKDGQYLVYAGDLRAHVAHSMGWSLIPCIIEDNVPQKTMNARAIKDNAHMEGFEWGAMDEWGTAGEMADWGQIDLPEGKKDKMSGEIQDEEIRFFKKTHILFSFHPSLFQKIESLIEQIKSTNGVEYEQGSN